MGDRNTECWKLWKSWTERRTIKKEFEDIGNKKKNSFKNIPKRDLRKIKRPKWSAKTKNIWRTFCLTEKICRIQRILVKDSKEIKLPPFTSQMSKLGTEGHDN